MKNPTLDYAFLLACLIFSISTFGQTSPTNRILTKSQIQSPATTSMIPSPVMDETHPQSRTVQAPSSLPVGTVTSSAVTAIKIGESSNVFTSLLVETNQLYSHLGAGTMGGSLSFIYRQNVTKCGGVPTNSGQYRYSISTDGGNSWDIGSNTVPPNPPTNTCYGNGVVNPSYTRPSRYPGAALFSRSNSPSTDSLALIYSGPVLQASGSGWDGWLAGTVLDPAGAFQVTQESYQQQMSNQYFVYSMVAQVHPVSGNQNFWFISYGWNGMAVDNSSLYLNKGTYDPATQTVNWMLAHTFTPPYNTTSLTGTQQLGSVQLSFGPNGQHVWIGMLTDLIGGQDSTFNPAFYHSDDGGDTWGNPEEIDMSQFPELKDSLEMGSLFINVIGDTVPLLTGKATCAFDCDLEVDSTGNPHMLVVVGGASAVTQNEANYTLYASVLLDVYDITKDSLGDWNMQHLANQSTLRGSFGNVGSGGPDEFTVDPYSQVTRSDDGNYIFFSWTDTDTTTGATTNSAPDLKGRAYNVATHLLTPIENWTSNDPTWAGKAVIPKTANIAFQNSSTFTVPTVITNLDIPTNALAQVSMWYFQDVTYDVADFTESPRFFYNCKSDPFANSTLSNPSACGTNNNGNLRLIPGGGNAPYTYQWGSGAGSATTDSVSGLSAGLYTVTVTDSRGCVDIVQGIINNTGAPSVAIDSTSVNDPQCFGLSNGTATANATGGTGSLAYSWSNGDTIASATMLPPGANSVTVTDSLGCSTFATVTLTAPPDITISSTSSGVMCAGDSTGTASIQASGGGGGPYFYSWNTGETTSTIVNKPNGVYTCSVTDNSGCVKIEMVTISQPLNALSVSTSGTSPSSCTALNGTATAFSFGGTPPYTYFWVNGMGSNVGSASFIFGLSSGQYILTVTDNVGCTTLDTIVLVGGSSLVAIPNASSTSCANASDGSVSLSISGATGNLTFLWSNGSTTQNLTGVPAGTYSVTITETNGCVAVVNATVGGPTAFFSQ
ncbi:SprB repeat-containing protein [bacterium]|nr:SprB repeat-containing protein [bacterium]